MAEGGRLYVRSTPATRGEESTKDSAPGALGPEGRFYLASDDNKAEKDRVTSPVEQAAQFAGQPPAKDEIRAAKKEQVAAAKATDPVPEDPAAETVHEEPVEAASEQAGDPPGQQPSASASRAEWEEYARTQGATDEDLAFEGKPLSRNALRDKYGLI
jgi:hypothetical protein